MAIAHGLSHHDNFRLNLLRLVAPKVRSGPTETRLNLKSKVSVEHDIHQE